MFMTVITVKIVKPCNIFLLHLCCVVVIVVLYTQHVYIYSSIVVKINVWSWSESN